MLKGLWAIAVCVAFVVSMFLLTCLADGRMIERIALSGTSARHIEAAQRWVSPSHVWAPPVSLDASDDHVLQTGHDWKAAALPDRRVQHAVGPETLGLGEAKLGNSQVVWYRFVLPPAVFGVGTAGPDLYVPRLTINGTAAIYFAGQRIWLRPKRYVYQTYYDPVLIHLADFPVTSSPAGPREVYLRVAARPENGGIVSSIWLASRGDLAGAFYLRSFLQTGVVWWIWSAYWVLGALSFAIWRHRRHVSGSAIYLWFSALALLIPTQLLAELSGSFIEVPEPILMWLSSTGVFLVPICVVHFYAAALGRRQPYLERIAWLLGITGGALETGFILTYAPRIPVLDLSNRLLGLLVLPVFFQNFYAICAAIRFRTRFAVLLGALAIVGLGAVYHDFEAIVQGGRAEDLQWLSFCFPISLVIYTTYLFRSYIGSMEAVEQASEHLRTALTAKEAELAHDHGRLLTIQREQTLSQERQRMMQEMHDGIGASLVSALRYVQHGQKDAKAIGQVLEECIDDLKLSIDSLEPADKDLLLLLSSLRFRLDSRLKGSGITLNWAVTDAPALPWLDAQSGMHILRALQEVLTNLLKHSGADIIHFSTVVEARDGASGVAIIVEDNGRPFTPPPAPQVPAARKGLGNIISRTRLLQGACQWEPLASGNRFVLWLPLVRGGRTPIPVRSPSLNVRLHTQPELTPT